MKSSLHGRICLLLLAAFIYQLGVGSCQCSEHHSWCIAVNALLAPDHHDHQGCEADDPRASHAIGHECHGPGQVFYPALPTGDRIAKVKERRLAKRHVTCQGLGHVECTGRQRYCATQERCERACLVGSQRSQLQVFRL